jgi:hypothetical protein
MTNENLIKAALMFGGGFALFFALRPRDKDIATLAPPATTTSPIKSFDSSAKLPPVAKENALIVAKAYEAAMQNGESPSRLTELNKECMAEFGMKCYMDKDGKLVVTDKDSTIIMTK